MRNVEWNKITRALKILGKYKSKDVPTTLPNFNNISIIPHNIINTNYINQNSINSTSLQPITNNNITFNSSLLTDPFNPSQSPNINLSPIISDPNIDSESITSVKLYLQFIDDLKSNSDTENSPSPSINSFAINDSTTLSINASLDERFDNYYNGHIFKTQPY
eukprot:105568_1